MVLGVDVGNTQTVLGLFDAHGLKRRWRLSTVAEATTDELRVKLAGLLAADGYDWRDVEGVAIASVVPPLTQAWAALAEETADEPPLLVGAEHAPALVADYENPSELGADRVANAVAAIERYGAPVVVVDFGTATTIDVVDGCGAYLGGAIAPGVETSAEALFAKAARLSEVDLVAPPRAIGRGTQEAVQSGLLLGEAAMVDGLVRRVWTELEAEAPVVATGGLAARMAPLCETVGHVDLDLTLEGLMTLWAETRGRIRAEAGSEDVE